MIVVAAFESPAVIAGLDDVAVMGQPSSNAAVILASPNTLGHSPNARLVVTMACASESAVVWAAWTSSLFPLMNISDIASASCSSISRCSTIARTTQKQHFVNNDNSRKAEQTLPR